MSIFKLRPVALGCFGFLLCLAASYFLGNIFNIIIIALGIGAVLALIIVTAITKCETARKWFIRLVPLCICLVICGTVSVSTFAKDRKILNDYAGEEKQVEVTVTEINYSEPYGSSVIAKTESEDKNFKLILLLPDSEAKIGDRISLKANFRETAVSTYGYNEKESYLDRGIFLVAEAEEYEIISRDNFILTAVFEKANAFLAKIVEDTVDSDTASLVSAMLLGNKDALDSGVRRDFSRLGISHVLALSGLHLSIITGLIGGILSLAQTPNRPKYVLLILIIGAFVCVTGFSESAIRAGLMLAIFYTMMLIGQRSDATTSLFASVMIICIIQPYSIFSTSLILSFAAMLACICTRNYTKSVRALYRIRPKALRGAVYTLITSVAVMLFTLPIIYLKFNYVSIFAPIFNVFIVPALTLLLYISPFVLVLGKIPYVYVVVKYPAQLLTKAILHITGNIARLDFLTVPFTNAFHTVGVLAILSAIILALVLSRKKAKYCIATVLAGIVIFSGASICSAASRQNQVCVSSLDTVGVDIVAIESKNEVMIIEMSSASASTSSMSSAYASSIGYSDIDTYVIADYSHRVVQAFDKISDITVVRSLMLPHPENEKELERYNEIAEICKQKGIELSEIKESFDFGEARVDFMPYTRIGRSTKRCIAFSVSANNARYTYLGASAYEYPNYFPENYASASDVVVLGKYGPAYKNECELDFTGVDYFVLHGTSSDYVSIEDDTKIKLPTHKFIFK